MKKKLNALWKTTQPFDAMKPHFLFFFTFLFLGSSSCGLFRVAGSEEGLPRKRSAFYLLRKMNRKRPEALWLNAKIRLSVETSQQRLKLTSYLRMKRDSAIWMNFKKFGIEAGRLLIRPDSAFFINRLDRTYFAERLSDLAKAYQLPADFGKLQELLLGYPVFSSGETKVQLVPGAYVLLEEREHFSDTLYLDAVAFLPQRWMVDHPASGLKASMSFENYRKLDGNVFFSYFRRLETFDKPEEGVKLEMQFEKVELNEPVGLPFEIPKRYERIR